VWDAAFGAQSDAFEQEVPLQVRLGARLAELSLNPQAAQRSQAVDERESLLQCGSALFHLTLALRRFGRLGRLELFPDLDQLSLVARASGEFNGVLNSAKSMLIERVSGTQRHTLRAGEAAVSAQILARLSAAGPGGKAWLAFSQCEPSRQRLCELAASRDPHPRTATSQVQEETARTASLGASPLGAIRTAWVHLRTSPMASRLLGSSTRTPSPQKSEPMRPERPEHMVALAVLKTKTDDRYGWLAAGELLARVQSEAVSLNVSSHVFCDAFRDGHTRHELRNIIGRKGFVQAIVGFGSRSAARTPNLDMSSMPHNHSMRPSSSGPLA
jgi:hypothetical protein